MSGFEGGAPSIFASFRCASSWYQEKLSWKRKIGQSTYCTLLYILQIYVSVYVHIYNIHMLFCKGILWYLGLLFRIFWCWIVKYFIHGIMTWPFLRNSWVAVPTAARKVRNVNGVFHLAGVLDDGIIGGDSTHRVEMGWDGKHICCISYALIVSMIFLSPLYLYWVFWCVFLAMMLKWEKVNLDLWALM